MSYKIELGPAGNVNRTLQADAVQEIAVGKPHTALADFDAAIPYDRGIKDRALDACRIYAGSDLIFRGYLKELDWDQQKGTVRLNGPGIGDDLRDSAIERSWTRKATWEAIKEVWTNDTAFSANVAPPNPTKRVDDKTIVDKTSSFGSIAGLAATDPVTVNGDIQLAQSAVLKDYEIGDNTFGAYTDIYKGTNVSGKIKFNNPDEAEAPTLGGPSGAAGDKVRHEFTIDYDWDQVAARYRHRAIDRTGDGDTDDLPPLSFQIDGTEVFTKDDRWRETDVDAWDWSSIGIGSMSLSEGGHTLKIIQTKDTDSTYDEIAIGITYLYDANWMGSQTYDNTVSKDSAGDYYYLDRPALHPDAWDLVFNQEVVDWNVVEITLDTSGWNNTTGGQAVAVSFDGGSSWTENANSTSVTASDTGNAGRTVDSRITLDRYSSGDERTPNEGDKGQKLGSVTVDYDGTDLSVIRDNSYRGSPLKILKNLHERAGLRFVIDHAATDNNDNLIKSAESFPRGGKSKAKDWSLVNRNPKLSFNKYANEVTVYGEVSNGTRPKATVEDTSEVNTYGRDPYFEILPDLTTVQQIRNAAIDILTNKVSERNQTGRLTVLPVDILPGYDRPVDWFADGTTTDTPLERVSYRESADDLSATLEFAAGDDVTATVINQGIQADQTREGI